MFEAHFQTFEDPEGGVALGARLAALREELARRNLTGFVVPRADSHQNEYVPPSDERLAWLTGFTGSAGMAAVLKDRAALFVDGRYTLQAAQQIDTGAWTVASLVEPPPESWLAQELKAGAELVPVETNPIDAVWQERPAPPLGQVSVHDLKYAGEAETAKLARIRD